MATPAAGGRIARGPRPPAAVWWVAGAVVVVLLLVAHRYGWHRDELYFLEAGRHLAWGYIDQPPFTPLVARVADEVATHDLLSTATFDLTAWMAAILVAARLLRSADPRWWIAFGAVAGVALLNKHLIVILAVTVVGGLVIERRWSLLVTPWAAAGAALTLAIASPNLIWQATNGWPQLDMADALSERLAAENRLTLLPSQLLFFGILVLPLLWWGARWLVRAPGAAAFRPLLWAWPVGLVLVFASGGRPYYLFPLTLAVGLAGLVGHEQEGSDLRRLSWFVVANAVLTLPLALPVLPESTATPIASVNQAVAETIGWPQMVEQVADVVAALPDDEQSDVVLLAASYGEAGALDRFGPEHGLPPAYSGHNSYADFRRPADDDATVVAVRYPTTRLDMFFEDCDLASTIETPHDVPSEIEGTPVHVCRGLRGTWADVWPRLRHLS